MGAHTTYHTFMMMSSNLDDVIGTEDVVLTKSRKSLQAWISVGYYAERNIPNKIYLHVFCNEACLLSDLGTVWYKAYRWVCRMPMILCAR